MSNPVAVSARRLTGPVLVAGVDGDDMICTLQTAQQLARRDDVAVHVIGVVPPLAMPPGAPSDGDRRVFEEARRRIHLERLREGVTRAVGISAHFTVDVASGRRSRALAREARARGAAVIITGIGRLGTDGRVATEDAALQLVLEVDIPIVAVPAGSTLLPRRCLVALDFGAASQCAARAAAQMLDGPSTLILAHVRPPLDDAKDSAWHGVYAQRATDLLAATAAQLAETGGLTIETLQAEGDPAAALLNLASTAVVDMVAFGVEGIDVDATERDRESRYAGSTTLALIHRSPTSVLVAPPDC